MRLFDANFHPWVAIPVSSNAEIQYFSFVRMVMSLQPSSRCPLKDKVIRIVPNETSKHEREL